MSGACAGLETRRRADPLSADLLSPGLSAAKPGARIRKPIPDFAEFMIGLAHRVRPELAIGPAGGRTRWAGPMADSGRIRWLNPGYNLCALVGRRPPGPLHFGCFTPPKKIIRKARKCAVERQSGLANWLAFGRQCLGDRSDRECA